MTETTAEQRVLITAGLVLAAMISALDATIAIIALPHIQSSLSASAEQITWVLTSYMVAQAMVMPLTGWLTDRLGMKTLLVICVSGFTVSSLLCAVATSLPEMVLYRILQGVLGAPLLPLSQAVLMNIYPVQRQGHAMAIWSMSTALAPVAGPALGGWITEHLSWRWCFYINVPIGVASLLLMVFAMPRAPVIRRKFDFLGFGSLIIGVAALQLLLDRGTSKDWFNSAEIWAEAMIAVGAFWVFLAHTLTARQPLFAPAIARDQNYMASIAFGIFFNVVIFGGLTLLPLMMQGIMGYSVLTSGLYSTPRGLATFTVLLFAGRLDRLLDRRLQLALGMTIMTYAYWRMAHFDLSMSGSEVAIATAIQGFGQGLAMVPLTTLSFATIDPALRAEASGIGNLIRGFGGSAGIAGMQALAIQNSQAMHSTMAGQVRMDDPVVTHGLPSWLSPETATGAMALDHEITRQAMMIGYVDDFRLMVVLGVICIPLILLFRNPRRAPAVEARQEAAAHA
jgi:DHA2 family multidrug resistance protein